MAKQPVAGIQFIDGAAVEDVVRIFVAGNLQTGNFNLSRLCFLTVQGEWLYWDVETIVSSVSVIFQPKRTYFALGRDGIVWVLVSGGEPRLERIDEAGTGKGKLGYLSQIREIGGDLYVCGDQGQVYRRTKKGWIHVDEGLLHRERRKQDISHNGIDGTAPDNIYVVGDYGRIFHFDGKRWNDVSYSTNVTLERVRCVSRDEIYICGDQGTLLKGDGKHWELVGDPEINGNIWDLEPFSGKLFLAVEDILMTFENGRIEPVETRLSPPVDAHRLGSRGKFLWSFGEEHLAYYDGKAWTRIVHPDNA